MVRTKRLKNDNPINRYKKVTKQKLPKEIKKETKRGKIVNSKDMKNIIEKKSMDSSDQTISQFKSTSTKDNFVVISPIQITECSTKKNDCKKNIHFDNEAKINEGYNNNNDDEDDGFFISSTNNNINESMLVSSLVAEKNEENSFHNDIILQGKSSVVGTIVRPIPNIKESNTNAFPSRLYVVNTKAQV